MVAPPTVMGVGDGKGRGEPSNGVATYSTLRRQLFVKAWTAPSTCVSLTPMIKVAFRLPKNPPLLASLVTEMPNRSSALISALDILVLHDRGHDSVYIRMGWLRFHGFALGRL
jgi:hypothetical protein